MATDDFWWVESDDDDGGDDSDDDDGDSDDEDDEDDGADDDDDFSAEFLRPLDSTWLPLNLVACCGCCGPLACCAGELGPNGVSGEHDLAGAAGRPRPRRPSPGPGSYVAAPLRSSLA